MNLLLRRRVIWFYAFRIIKVRLIYIKKISNNLIHRDHVSASFFYFLTPFFFFFNTSQREYTVKKKKRLNQLLFMGIIVVFLATDQTDLTSI